MLRPSQGNSSNRLADTTTVDTVVGFLHFGGMVGGFCRSGNVARIPFDPVIRQ